MKNTNSLESNLINFLLMFKATVIAKNIIVIHFMADLINRIDSPEILKSGIMYDKIWSEFSKWLPKIYKIMNNPYPEEKYHATWALPLLTKSISPKWKAEINRKMIIEKNGKKYHRMANSNIFSK